jgi:hypothetical protein
MGERVDGLVLVDGALPIPVDLPPDADIEAVVRDVIGPALDSLDATFGSPDEYVEMWRSHPPFGGGHVTDVAEAYVRYDLVPDGGVWRSPVSKTAVLADEEHPPGRHAANRDPSGRVTHDPSVGSAAVPRRGATRARCEPLFDPAERSRGGGGGERDRASRPLIVGVDRGRSITHVQR